MKKLVKVKRRADMHDEYFFNWRLMVTVVLVVMLCFAISAYSQDSKGIGKYGAAFLQISPSARQVGMGEAFTGLADDVNLMRYNIGGLANIRRRSLAVNFHPWIQDTQQGSIVFASPYPFGTVGFEFAYFNEGKIIELDEDFEPTGGSSYSDDVMFSIGQSGRLPILKNYLSYGGAIKYVRQNLVGIASTALALDLGLHLNFRNLFYGTDWSMGATIQNISISRFKFDKGESLFPETYRAGLAVSHGLSYEGKEDALHFNFAADAAWLNDQKPRYYAGGEIIIGHVFAMRGGYKFHDFEANRFSAGFGLIMPMRWLAKAEGRLDYSYSPLSAFEEAAHRFSLLFNFGAVEEDVTDYEKKLAEYRSRLNAQLAEAERRMKALEDSMAARLARIQRIAAESEGKIEVEPQSREKILVSMRINFDFDKANIRPEEFPTMHQVGQILNTYPESRVFISGHTDFIGPDEYNILLSHRRVDSVMTHLINKENVQQDRFYMPIGYGEMKPVATNETEEGRFRNRRVEFLLYTLGSEPEMPEGSAIKGVEVVDDKTMRVVCNGKVNYTTNVMELPDRLILDFPGIFIITDQSVFEINRGSVIRARLGYHKIGERERFSRVVFDLSKPIQFTTEAKDNYVIVHIQ